MKIGIIGSGMVGQALARGFVSRGHDVMIGSRDPEKLAEFAAQAKVRTGTFDQTAAFAETAVIATAYSGTASAIDLAKPANLDGKIVIDATNPLKFEEGKPMQLAVGFDDSAGEQVQRRLPGAKVVKAFNIVGNTLMVDPKLPGGPPTMFIAGNDDAAKRTVRGIIESFGWPDVADLGRIEESRYLEPLAMVWIHFGARTGGWTHAFRMLVGK